MIRKPAPTLTAFLGARRIASGELREVAAAIKSINEGDDFAPLLIFDDETGKPVEIDLRGSLEEVLARLPKDPEAEAEAESAEASRQPGRPKLGVVAREVTLLPRHWEWLGSQPGGASVTLRKLVEEARKSHAEEDRLRGHREAAYRFMTAMAGNEAGFEEAIRALFAGQREPFESSLATWPPDVREHARTLAQEAFPGSA